MVQAAEQVVQESDKVLDSDRLPDPCNDRQVKSVKAPPVIPLSLQRVLPMTSPNSEIKLELVKNYLQECGMLSQECLMDIMRRTKYILKAEPNLMRVEGKVVMIGDIHGQFFDLLAMLRKIDAHNPSEEMKLVFMGDYVDRGNYGPEVAAYLFCMKLKHPDRIFLLRGNHESRDMAESFNFRQQVLNLYDQAVYEEFMETFDVLPVAAQVNG